MEWNKIEAKWVAMTRRVRGDLTSENAAAENTETQHVTRPGLSTANMRDRQAKGLAENIAQSPSE